MSAAVGVAIGAVVAALAIEGLPALAVLLFGVALAIAGVAVRRERRVAPRRVQRVPLLAIAVGVMAIGLRAGTNPATVAVPLPAGEGPWRADVLSVGSEHGPTRPAVLRLDATAGSPGLVVAATLPWYPAVGAGDRIEVGGRIEPPKADDYGTYLARIGAGGTLRADSLALLPPPTGFDRWLEELRRGAANALARAVPEPEAGLADGILIGLRDHVDRQLAADFTTAGVSHVVAISGWNIAIVATTIGALAGSLRRRRRAVLTGIAILAYVAFVGPSPSVVRAGAMAGLVLLARELGRPSTATAALGWAVAGLLFVDPGWIEDAGFRLSVLATAGLMAWGTRLATELGGSDPGRLRRWLAESLGVSLAAQAATLPVILLSFGRLSLVAPVVNLAVVPLVAPAMAAGAVALVAGAGATVGLPGAIATIGGLPAWTLLGAVIGIVRFGAGLPLASVTLEPPFDLIAAIVSAALVVIAATRGRRLIEWLTGHVRGDRAQKEAPRHSTADSPARRAMRSSSRPSGRQHRTRLAIGALVASSLALGFVLAERPSGVVSVTVLDVGQGDGILVESGTGLRLLVDGGPDPSGLVRTLDERLPPWDRRIDIVVLTHPHEDHVAGMALLLARYHVGRVYEPGMIGPGPGYSAWEAAVRHGGPAHGTLATGDHFALGQISFSVLWPDPGRVPLHPADGGTAINNVSIVLLGRFAGHSFLLAGDIEQGVDPELLARGLPRVELLKVAHHGSKTASTEPFLEALDPKVAIVSAGLGNPYGHPAPATIDRLHAITRQTYRTDLDGTVEVRFEGDVLRVRTSGPHRAAAATAPTWSSTAPSVASAALPTTASTAPARLAFACAITTSSTNRPLPPVAEAPSNQLADLGRPPGPWDLHRLPRGGVAGDLAYHRADDRSSGSDRSAILPRRSGGLRAARLPVGRRRVRPGRGGRYVPDGCGQISDGGAGPLATGGRQRRRGTGAWRARRAARHRLAVR